MNKKGLALIITAPSGAGKTTLIEKLLKEFPNITFSVSYTTREPRPGEIHGKDYFFVEKKKFEKLIQDNFFAEWAEVHGNYYGTPISFVNDTLETGKDVIFDIDIQGAKQLKNNINNSVAVFIIPPSRKSLEERIKKRGKDSQQSIMLRLARAKKEIETAYEFDFLILNDKLDKAYEQLKSVYISEKCRVIRNKAILDNILNNWEQKVS